jgi:peptide-methionine (R)-S-oxide reductase
MNKNERNKLTDEQYAVARQGATEPPFSGTYNDEKRQGIYLCVTCNQKLFDSKTKYESGSGWPAFYSPSDEASIIKVEDTSHGMIRTEVKCSECDSHLGHVFPDGPEPTGLRYCINSIVMNFVED